MIGEGIAQDIMASSSGSSWFTQKIDVIDGDGCDKNAPTDPRPKGIPPDSRARYNESLHVLQQSSKRVAN